jgi:hypothetical protein
MWLTTSSLAACSDRESKERTRLRRQPRRGIYNREEGMMRVFVAGASGAIGTRLVPQLVDRGHDVIGTFRSPGKGDRLRALWAEPVALDLLDADAVRRFASWAGFEPATPGLGNRTVPNALPGVTLVLAGQRHFRPGHAGTPMDKLAHNLLHGCCTPQVKAACRYESRDESTQNSLPSGSLRTTHDCSPWPTSA